MKITRFFATSVAVFVFVVLTVFSGSAIDCSHNTADQATKQENVVEATYTKAGSYDNVTYCGLCGDTISRTKVKTEKKILPVVDGIVLEAIAPDLIKLYWNGVNEADGYIVYLFNYATNEFEECEIVNSGSIGSVGITSVYADADNRFMVKAYVKEDGKIIRSDESEVVVGYVKPAKPCNLKFTSTASEVTVTWDKVAGAEGYRFYKYNLVTKKFEKCASVKTNKYTFSIKTQGSTDRVAVKAYKKAEGKTLWSVMSSPITVGTIPPAVKDIKYKVTTEGIELIWPENRIVDGYKIYQYNSKTEKWIEVGSLTVEVHTGSVNYFIKASAGKIYKFKIRTFKKCSGKTLYSDYSKAVTVISAPKKVKKFKASSQTTTSLKLSWSKVSGAKGYRVYMYDMSKRKWKTIKTTAALTYTLENLKPGTIYEFRIRAYKKINGDTVWSEYTGPIETMTKPASVTALKASSVTAKSVKLLWKKVDGATGYNVYIYNSETKKWDKIKATSKTSYTVKKLDKATKYKFRVRAYSKLIGKTYWGACSKSVTVKTK